MRTLCVCVGGRKGRGGGTERTRVADEPNISALKRRERRLSRSVTSNKSAVVNTFCE